MSKYPWRNTSEDIAAEAESQWETPGGAQEKADAAEQAAKDYSDQNLNAHIGTGGTAHAVVVAAGAAGFMTGADKTKLDGVATGANNYVHPATHPPSIIAQDANNRFVTDVEKAEWNDKAPSALATATTDGLMPATDKDKLDKATNAPTASTIVARDASGRAQVAAPSVAGDIARKAETDAVQTNLNSHASNADVHVTAAEHAKLNGIQTGAEVNQNAFSAVNGVSATSKSDTLQLTGGTGITITEDPASKRVTVTATGSATPGAHASSHITGGTDVIPNAVTNGASGLMSGSDAQFVRIEGETKAGAQNKADAALVASTEYTDGKIAAIPPVNDASLTQKGVVQLSNSTTGSSQTTSGTEKAVSDARVSAISAASTDATTKANAAESSAKAHADNLVGILSNLQTTAKANTVAAINELFTSVSNGKTAVAAAITGKGVPASGSDTFSQLATKIGQIQTGAQSASGITTTGASVGGYFPLEVSGLTFKPNIIVFRRNDPNIQYASSSYSELVTLSNGSRYVTVASAGTNPSANVVIGQGLNVGNFFVHDSGFKMPASYEGVAYAWAAFRI